MAIRNRSGRFTSARLTPTGAKGVATIEWHGADVLADVEDMIVKRLDKAAILVAEEARESMARAKTGDTNGKFARRSAPGEPPASQHGEAGLSGSVAWEKDGKFSRQVGTNLKYGLYLEEGAPEANLEARPWLVVALMTVAGKVKRLFRG